MLKEENQKEDGRQQILMDETAAVPTLYGDENMTSCID